jgi:phytoene dehydrogenase-like protein
MVLLPVSNMQERGGNADYDSLIAAGRQRVLDTLGDSVGLQQSDILRETVRAPPGWRQLYGLEHGAAFGLSHGLDQLAILRPGCVDADAPRGLFFVGASSRPGNGIPLVMLGAQQTAERILRAG